MRKRQKEKLIISTVVKICNKVLNPGENIKVTRAEQKVFASNWNEIEAVARETLKQHRMEERGE